MTRRSARFALLSDRLTQGKSLTITVLLGDDSTRQADILARIGRFVIHRCVDGTFSRRAWIVTHEPTTKLIAATRTFTHAISLATDLESADQSIAWKDQTGWNFTTTDNMPCALRDRSRAVLARFKPFIIRRRSRD